MMELQEYIPNQIWTCKYPVRYAGCDFTGRMTVIRLANGYLMLHSPCQIDADLKQAIQALGEVGYLDSESLHLHRSSLNCFGQRCGEATALRASRLFLYFL
jgi:hypothetical protein